MKIPLIQSPLRDLEPGILDRDSALFLFLDTGEDDGNSEDHTDTGGGSESNLPSSDVPDPEEPDDSPPDPRPWPDDSQMDGPMENIYALLVGINDYSSAPLNGCVKDVDQIQHYLEGQYPADRLKLKVLKDKDATYEGIIKGFREHLCQAGPRDSVWFHFSGHGTEAFAANEMLELEPNGKDQNLVCHESSSQLLLADKELAVLLKEVATQDAQGRSKKSPHIVVSLDCCHSGSGTRDFGEPDGLRTRNMNVIAGKTRASSSVTDIRPLETYIDGFYKRQLDEMGRLEVPGTRHVLLSACTSIQKAGDLPRGGVFTCSLIETLELGQGSINYADLFVRTRATARKIREEQTPQFETFSNFDPYTMFLEGSPLGTPDRIEVLRKVDKWFVKSGAIHGVPVQSDEPIQLEIQTASPENKPVALAKLMAVGAQESPFEVIEGGPLDKDTQYQAVIRHLPAAPVRVYLHGEESAIGPLLKDWDQSRNVLPETDPNQADDCQLEIEATGGNYVLRDRRKRNQIESLAISHDHVQKLVKDLNKIAKWERTLALDNPDSKIKNWVDLELSYMNSKMEKVILQGPEAKIYASEETLFLDSDSGAIGCPFYPVLKIKKTSQELYGYMFHMRSDYSIDAYEGEKVFRPEENPNKTSLDLPLWTGDWGWGLSKTDQETVSYFKMLVTTEPLDHQQLLQSGINDLRDLVFKWKKMSVQDDWCCVTIKVSLSRATSAVTGSGVQNIPGSKVSIHPHPGIKANASLASSLGHPDSQDPACRLAAFDTPGFRMMDLVAADAKFASRVLELTDLQVASQEPMKDQPLVIDIEGSLADGETLVPVLFDGKDFQVAGSAEATDGKIRATLPELPFGLSGNTSGENPFVPGDTQDPSLYQAVKIGFFRQAEGAETPSEILNTDRVAS